MGPIGIDWMLRRCDSEQRTPGWPLYKSQANNTNANSNKSLSNVSIQDVIEAAYAATVTETVSV